MTARLRSIAARILLPVIVVAADGAPARAQGRGLPPPSSRDTLTAQDIATLQVRLDSVRQRQVAAAAAEDVAGADAFRRLAAGALAGSDEAVLLEVERELRALQRRAGEQGARLRALGRSLTAADVALVIVIVRGDAEALARLRSVGIAVDGFVVATRSYSPAQVAVLAAGGADELHRFAVLADPHTSDLRLLVNDRVANDARLSLPAPGGTVTYVEFQLFGGDRSVSTISVPLPAR